MNQEFLTPLKRARGLGAGHAGSHHWWWQRLTAVGLVFLLLWFAFALGTSIRYEYADFIAYWRFPMHQILAMLTVGLAFMHAQIGLSEVIEDYIHHKMVKLCLKILLKFVCFGLTIIFIYALILIRLV